MTDSDPQELYLSAYALSIYARQVKTELIDRAIPETQMRYGKPERREVKRNYPRHFAWFTMALNVVEAEKAGMLRAVWMCPPNEGYVEWDVQVTEINRETIIAMLKANEVLSDTDLEYDYPQGLKEREV